MASRVLPTPPSPCSATPADGFPASAALKAASAGSRPTNRDPIVAKGRLRGWRASVADAFAGGSATTGSGAAARAAAGGGGGGAGGCRALRLRDLRRDPDDFVGGVRHVPFALARRIVRERLQVLWTNVPVAHRVERVVRGCRQEQRIAANVLLVLLPLSDGRDLGFQDVLGRERLARDEQNEDVACLKLLFDLPVPVVAAAHEVVDPEVGQTLRDRGLKVAGDEREPFDRVAGRRLRFVLVRVADED